jgi:hypothetical protein
MHATKLLAEGLALVRQLDYVVREEDLEGAGGGHCAFAGKKWLLLDVTQSAREQLEDVLDALRSESAVRTHTLSPQLAALIVENKKAA